MFDLDGGKRRKSRGSKKSRKGSKKSRKASKKTRKGGKNEFFKLMLKAKKDNAPSFKYNGKTYHRKQKKHLVFYKA